MTMGEARTRVRYDALLRLVGHLRTPGGLKGGRTLAGAWFSERAGLIRIRAAPPRRGRSLVQPAPSLRRACDLLADPRISTIHVR